MRLNITALISFSMLVVFTLADQSTAQEPTDVSAIHQRIVADYQQLASRGNAATREAAGRLARDAYRLLIEQAGDIAEMSAEDLYALGACHEELGDAHQASEMYSRSLAKMDVARTRLGLVRINLVNDLPAAEAHLAEAKKLQPEYAGINQFQVLLSAAHQRQRQWDPAIAYLERYLGYTKSLIERRPGNRMAQQTHAAVQSRLDRLRIFSGMLGKQLPVTNVEAWIQGEATEIADLKDKVVVIDFFAPWSEPSRNRMNVLKELHAAHADKGLEIVGLTRTYRRRWEPESESFSYDANMTPETEQANVAAFASSNEIEWRLGQIDAAVADEYGVYAFPHTVVCDRAGNVKLIMLEGNDAAMVELKEAVVSAIGEGN